MKIDLRSDTVTRPSSEMLRYMLQAKVGDDVYKEDSATNELEKKLADLFGMEAALYFPTGTMANQAAIKLHTHPGEQLIADKWAHVYNFEGGGASFNSGVSCKLIDGDRGKITAKQVEENINPPDFYHSPLTTLVCLENTTNKGGGACYDFEEIQKIKMVCASHNLGLHLDGARIWDALIAKNENPKQYGEVFDTISVCLSKGLGAPIGSVLLGNDKLMKHALRIRKILGGGMRQIGYMAAAGIYALDTNFERLEIDHKKAFDIAEVLQQTDYVSKVEPVETNIIIFTLKENVKQQTFVDVLQKKEIQISTMGAEKLRIVTHLDYSDSMHEYFLKTLTNLQL